VPAVLTNELHDMSTHRVPIQTLRPPKGTGPEVRCHPGVLVRNRSSCTAPGSARFAPGAHLPCRGLSILVFDANTTEHPGLSPGMLFHVIGLRVIPFPRYYHFCTICLSKTSEPHVLCEPPRRGRGRGRGQPACLAQGCRSILCLRARAGGLRMVLGNYGLRVSNPCPLLH
jgi:hypothetical protein